MNAQTQEIQKFINDNIALPGGEELNIISASMGTNSILIKAESMLDGSVNIYELKLLTYGAATNLEDGDFTIN